MSQFLASLESEILSRGLFARGQKILVAVSGGADSMVLLHALHSLAPKFRWQISVAHFNHQLRGRASHADEKLVRQTAAVLRVPFFVESADVKAFAKKARFSIEMAARKLRHEFFARTAKSQKKPIVALAHHADDQVELFFLRVLRGAGGEGLAGMKWQSPSPADKNITLVRPLLGLTKSELLTFARENKIHFREDATNASLDFLRNRIRNELIPLLQKNYQPGLAKTVLRLMDITGAEAEFVNGAARQWLAKPKTSFATLGLAVQRKILQRQLAEQGVAVDFELVEQLRKTSDIFFSINSSLSVAREAAGKLTLREQICDQFNAEECRLNLQGRAGQSEFGGLVVNWALKNVCGASGRSPRQKATEFFDAEKVGGEIILRHWRAGDRFQPIGLKSPVKLQDLFVNAKIPRARRRKLVVAATAAGEIFWVQSLRMSERFKLTPATRRRLVWAWRPV